MIIVTIVGFCTLMMPAPVSGARPALSVTVMLTTATVYLVASRFTPHSNTLTSLSRMYILCFSMSALLVLVSIVTTSLNLIGPDDKISDQALSDWFRHFDADNSGFLDRKETAQALMALGLDRKERGRVFAIFDANNDGMIDIEEWRAISEITKKHDNLATFHNVLTSMLVKDRMWKHERKKRTVEEQEMAEQDKSFANQVKNTAMQALTATQSVAQTFRRSLSFERSPKVHNHPGDENKATHEEQGELFATQTA